MIHWQTVKEFFGFGTTAVDETAGHSWSPAPPPLTGSRPIRKSSLRAGNYYRRNGRFYSSIDGGLIEDVLMLVAIQELFDDGDIREYDETVQEYNVPETNTFNGETDLLDVDVSDTPVVAAEPIRTPEPSHWNEPEPVRQESYSSGYSDGGCSSSDSDGGGDD